MSSAHSTESVLKQLASGILSGTVVGALLSRGHRFVSCLTFTSIGLLDAAYHFNYLKAHITHLTQETFDARRDIRTRFNHFQRDVQREFRVRPDDFNQELRWLWTDLRRQIDTHIYYGLGFAMAFLLSTVFIPRAARR